MLKPKKKILRKEIKKDPVLEKISQAEHFIRTNGKRLTYVLIAVVVLVVVSLAMIQSKKRANRAAAGALGMAEIALASGDIDNAIIQFEDLIDKNPGTKSAGMASILLAQAHLAKEDYESAEECFRNYIDDYEHEAMLTATAYNGLGVCAERTGNRNEAARYYVKGAEIAPYKFLEYDCYLNAVRNYVELQNVEMADRLINQISVNDLSARNKVEYESLSAKITVLKG
jgi:predicted negative regulator of RcsB-dependent stress response